ncbi:NOT2/NOT3/NOT5 family protein [Fusarium oxysporum f. sp. phaseoli]
MSSNRRGSATDTPRDAWWLWRSTATPTTRTSRNESITERKTREQQLWLGVWRGSHGWSRSPKRWTSTWRKRELRTELVGLPTCNITRPITSEFPSLSNNAQMSNPNQSSMWSTAGSRNLGGPSPRNQATPQQGGQDDMFSPTSSRGQGGFRFGNQGNIGQQTQSSSVDDFPPLNQTSNGEMGSDRTASLMSSLGFSSQAAGAGPSASNRGNGLLNALSANSRANEARSPPGIGAPGSSRPQDGKPPGLEEPRQKSSKEDAVPDDASNAADYNNADYSATNYVAQTMQKRLDTEDVIDPLEGMPASDKWGLKGLTTLMNNYPDYHAMVVGMDPNSLGLDINSQELFSTQIYSLFDDAPPRPVLSNGRFRLPDCYNVTNVQPIESKIQSFNEETLFWIFYSCTADVKQQMAAVELHSRNWRWHKKHQIWLTKDEHMTPQILSPNHERGYYVVWDTNSWRKERKELTLHYGDLDTTLGQAQVVP